MPVGEGEGEGADTRPDADVPLAETPYGPAPSAMPAPPQPGGVVPDDPRDHADPRDHVADLSAETDDQARPPRRPAARLGLLLAVAGGLAVLLVAGVVAVLTGLAALVPEDPPVTTAAGTLADPVPVGEAWRTFADGAPELDVAVTDVDLDSDAAPAGIVAASDRVVAATVRIESHGVLTRTIDLVELEFRTPAGDLVDTTTTDLWAPDTGLARVGTLDPGEATTVTLMYEVPAGEIEGGTLVLTRYSADDEAVLATG
ncbi:hypothetical protein BFL34_01360 [Clavibacter michiganensis]|uniref:DUF4352 domain-containing protein n=1 Tax=Clavibacter michiganensis TaxID=28447 RepID=A0A251Y8D8_9MICO|nr:hypothetical protein [Clavibacter michiganensis]OUE20542.1 hypothetical protein BFL34_01360 [Clavibacter michiganensis]